MSDIDILAALDFVPACSMPSCNRAMVVAFQADCLSCDCRSLLTLVCDPCAAALSNGLAGRRCHCGPAYRATTTEIPPL